MNSAVLHIKFLMLGLGALMLAVDISLFCFVQYNIWHLHVYVPEPAVRSAHIAAEVTTMLNCIMCFADCYVTCFERVHSRRHVKAVVYAVLVVCIFMSNTASYFYISHGTYLYTIPTRNITAFSPRDLSDIWFDEIHQYLEEYESSRNETYTRDNARRILSTLDYFQDISRCCGVISFADYTTLGVPMPKTCECNPDTDGIMHACTRGKRLTGLRSVGGIIDMTEWRKHMGRAPAGGLAGSVGDAAPEYELKRRVHKDGCEEHRAKYVYVLTGMLRLLVSSNSLQFLSIIMIPIPWLYEK